MKNAGYVLQIILSLLSAFIWYKTFSSAIIMNLYIPSIVMTEYIELSE